MPCIDDRPNCGDAGAAVNDESFWEVVDWILRIFGLAGIVISVVKLIGAISVTGGVISIGGISIATGLFAGGAVGVAVAVVTLIIVINSARDRGTLSSAESECVAGVVSALVPSFSEARDDWLPWQAMHDRVDLIVKSFFWQVVETGSAYVFCTDDPRPRRSEIMRCYFFEQRVCDAASGAAAGAAAGAVAGIVAAALIAAALCTTVVLCLLGLVLAAIVAAAAVLGGAAIGGQIAKANSAGTDPAAATGETLSVGHLVTVNGPMERRGYDDGANVIYWADSALFHGVSMSPQPFSYCEIDDELEDGCPRGPVIE
jgi:hypothetical protein